MLIRLCANQLKDNWELIEEAIDSSFPESAIETKNVLLRDLMLDIADCWFNIEDSKITSVFITRVTDDYLVGRKTFTIIAAYAISKNTKEMFLEFFETGKKYAEAKGCKFIDFYTDNPRILEYARMFDIFWESTYMQIKL